MSSSPTVCASPSFAFPAGGDYFSTKSSTLQTRPGQLSKKQQEVILESLEDQPDYFSTLSQPSAHDPNYKTKHTVSPPAVKQYKQHDSFESTASRISIHSGGHSATSSMTMDDAYDDRYLTQVRQQSDRKSLWLPQWDAKSSQQPLFGFSGPKPPLHMCKSSSPPPLVSLSSVPISQNATNAAPPEFQKHNSSPMNLHFGSHIASHQVHPNIPVPNDSRPLIEQLPNVSYLPSPRLPDIMTNSNTLIVDARPFADYLQSHIKGAINICLPLTLLRRQTYSISRCFTSMPAQEKSIVNAFIERQTANDAVILYDTTASSSNLYHLARKFGDRNVFVAKIYILDTTYAVFKEIQPDYISSGTCSAQETMETETAPLAKSLSYCSLDQHTHSSSLPFTPILSNFKLPDTPRNVFRIRHNEEVLSPMIGSTSSIPLTHARLSAFERQLLPRWLVQAVDHPEAIEKDFQTLEKYEKKRLLQAFSGQKTESSSVVSASSPTFVPSISSGIEMGHKNRYKDIFVYDHSRVRLQDGKYEGCDYINASYVGPSALQEFTKDSLALDCNYIATQGPLESTIGDFWKCALDNHCTIIASLTDETENGVAKCSPFWKSGTYTSNSSTLRVVLDEVEQIDDTMLLRRFTVSLDNTAPVKIIQAHLLSWPDMGSMAKTEDILAIIFLKQFLQRQIPASGPALIHCSAGCGRTGTLCAIDTILSIMNHNGTTELVRDPVYDIVNSFRSQRISMVQNLRQYNSIYDTILLYLKDEVNNTRRWKLLQDNLLVQNFLK